MTGKKKEQRRQKKAAGKTSSSSSESAPWVAIQGAGALAEGAPCVELPPEEWFGDLRRNVLDTPAFGKCMDGIMRNLVRYTVQAWIAQYAAIPLLQPKNSLWLQLLLIDENRAIQGKFYGLGAKVSLAESHEDVVERSRNLFREAVPLLLQSGADHWVFSRSMFLPGFNGAVEDAIGFPSFDPLNALMDLPEDLPDGVRCTEAFLFLAGDFPSKDGFCSREAVLELLHELSSPAGSQALLGFWVCCGSAKVRKEKVGELKGVHVPVKSQ